MRLRLTPSFFKKVPTHWVAVDAGISGELLMAQVQAARSTGTKPLVLKAGTVPSTGWEAQPLSALLNNRSMGSKATVAVLPRGQYQLVQLPRPPVPAAEMQRSVKWAMASQVDFDLEDAVLVTMDLPQPRLGESTVSPVTAKAETESNDATLYAVTAQKQVVDQVAHAFKDAGQRLDAVDVRETAQRNIAALLEAPDECLCLLRVTTVGIQLTFTHRGELYLDRFIAQPMSVLQGADDFERQRFIERMVQQTQVSVNHIQSHHGDLKVKRVVLCPLPAALRLEEPLREQLGLPLETLDLSTVFDLSAVPSLAAASEQARYFVALGASLRGMGTHA